MRTLYYYLRRISILRALVLWAAPGLLASCDDLGDRLGDLGGRVERLETRELFRAEKYLSDLRLLAEAARGNDYITRLESNADGSFTLWLASAPLSPVTVYPAYDGLRGRDGRDAVMGVRLVDGVYYWTVNGELTGMRADGTDGRDGRDATADPGGIVLPMVRVNDGGYWVISTDGGATWDMLTTPDGKLVYANGDSGEPDLLLLSVTVSGDGKTVVFVLTDGTVITLDLHP